MGAAKPTHAEAWVKRRLWRFLQRRACRRPFGGVRKRTAVRPPSGRSSASVTAVGTFRPKNGPPSAWPGRCIGLA
jgi:hypothetical protein